MTQNYRQNRTKILLVSLLFLFAVRVSADEVTPFKAIYDLYLNGYYVGEVEQTLSGSGNYWVITQITKAKGFASLFQSEPIVEKQSFILNNDQINLISFQFEDDKTTSSAYYQNPQSILQINHKGKLQKIVIKQPIYSYLLLTIKARLSINNDEVLTVFDQGSISKINATVSARVDTNHEIKATRVVNFSDQESDKKLVYTFNEGHVVPVTIERLSNNKVDMLLELKD